MDPLARAKGGDRWAAGLPEVIAELAARWDITVGRPLDGGTASYVVEARRANGDPAVLKISVPGVDVGREARTLLAAAGRGYVRVLAVALDRHAILLESLGTSLDRSGMPAERQLAVLAGLLPLAWQVPDQGGSPLDKAADLAEFITAYRDERHVRIVDEAMRCAERRSAAFDPDRCVVVHGDAAAANVLRRPGDGWVFVDPDGFVGDPAYDRGVAARDWGAELLAAADPRALMRTYCRLLGGDPAVTWEWAFLERVSTGLYIQHLGGDGTAHLASAHALLD
jgi:streptomycin 6-kinase